MSLPTLERQITIQDYMYDLPTGCIIAESFPESGGVWLYWKGESKIESKFFLRSSVKFKNENKLFKYEDNPL